MNLSNNYRYDVDGLRAIAVLSVVLFHLGIQGFSGGYVGVDVFFVISGFLITQKIMAELLETNRFNYQAFYCRRIRRLFPALFVTLALSFITAFFLLSPDHLQRFSGTLGTAVLGLSNVYLWQESSYFDVLSDFKPLLHTWSLGVEEQFYLIWPVLLVVFMRLHKISHVVIGIVILGIMSLALNILFQNGISITSQMFESFDLSRFQDGQATIFYLMPFRIFEFSVGAMLVFCLEYQWKNKHFSEAIGIAGAALIALSVISFDANMLFPSWHALLPCIGAACMIYANDSYINRGLLSHGLTVTIGRISYSLYLIHWPIIVFYKYYYSVFELSYREKAAILLLSMVLAWLMYRWIEIPFRSGLRIKKVSSLKYNSVCAFLASVLLLVGIHAWSHGGWKWRAEGSVASEKNLDLASDFHKKQYGGVDYPYDGWISALQQDANKANLILIGDSHARQLAHGLDKYIGKANQQAIYISSISCIVLPGFSKKTPGFDWDSLCPNALSQALKQIKNSPHATVMIGESWGPQINKAKVLGSDANMDVRNLVLSGLSKLKHIIGDRNLIIMGGVPGSIHGAPVTCFTRPKLSRRGCENHLTFHESEGLSYQFNKQLEKYAKETSGVYFLNPYQVFCQDGICSPIDGREIFYSDDDHLSKAGSDKVIRYFQQNIINIIEHSDYTEQHGKASTK